jgi:hypothetical protein
VTESYSEWSEVYRIVPQRSVLSPLLFLLLINCLSHWTKSSILMCPDADVSKTLKNIKTVENDRVAHEVDLDQLMDW